ncbi:hypothetical protein TZ00_13710 [Agreia bicolorata]|nr:hypothetical protein TZ00_13710 [Agreia bicolorata]
MPPRKPSPAASRPAKIAAPALERFLSLMLVMVSVTILALLANLVLVSPVQHYASQNRLYQDIRLALAEGSAPTGPVNPDGTLVEPGTALGVLYAPIIGIGHEVMVEGTSAAQTMEGIGHRRDTVLPCQVGTSVLMARSGAYGGVGQAFTKLVPGDKFSVTVTQGSCTYEVISARRPGDQAPSAPAAREGRLTLTTASGAPFMPTEVYRVDAKLVTDAFDHPSVAFPTGALPSSEAAMGTDTSNLFALVLLLELLVGVAIGVSWLWRRWGRWQTWIVGAPAIIAVGLLSATAINQWLLPNLL